ncbi:MAG: hypothetical protein FH749_06240 [Firmicutes bacterium]|nr:hypothetical protein [Bacillota bacterium]
MSSCIHKQQNSEHCTCTYNGCPRHGMCCQCLHYHRRQGQLPACYFSAEDEKTYDRSIARFVRANS